MKLWFHVFYSYLLYIKRSVISKEIEWKCEGIFYSIQVIPVGLNSWMDFIENFVKILTMVSVLSTKLL